MPKVGNYSHRVELTGLNLGFTNNYSVDKVQQLQLMATSDSTSRYKGGPFGGQLSFLRVEGTKTADVNSITLMGTSDAFGRKLVLEPTTATLVGAVDVGASGRHSAVYKIDIWFNGATDDLFLFIKTNAGTFSLHDVTLTWRE
jgi:hypothetical protein|tara:strand:+ start:965 stop:1393 length:429 start_codon:yes stop_codon:yes gene_type:complete